VPVAPTTACAIVGTASRRIETVGEYRIGTFEQ
jgi:hypothetical protein